MAQVIGGGRKQDLALYPMVIANLMSKMCQKVIALILMVLVIASLHRRVSQLRKASETRKKVYGCWVSLRLPLIYD